MLRRPMKAPGAGVTVDDLRRMRYPIACSAKLDGIRGCRTEERVVSATLKPIGNRFIQRCLDDSRLIGMDGELVVGLPHTDLSIPDDDVFNRTTGAVRASAGEPDFRFYVFDDFTEKKQTYQNRWMSKMPELHFIKNPWVVILEQRICFNFAAAEAYENELIEMGYEGMMARTLHSPYKEGRVTMNEGYIYKRKPLEQSEGIVVGIYEQMENKNEKVVSLLGTSTRSGHKENKVGKDTLGGVIIDDPRWPEPFKCGTVKGGTKEWRKKIFDNPELILGATVTYLYQGYGSIDAPRQCRMKAEFRDPNDITLF